MKKQKELSQESDQQGLSGTLDSMFKNEYLRYCKDLKKTPSRDHAMFMMYGEDDPEEEIPQWILDLP
jgi:hypothetical protein